MNRSLLPFFALLIVSAIVSPAQGQNQDIYAVNLKTGTPLRVTMLEDTDEYNPSFSNDGRYLVHDVLERGGPGHDLYVTEVKTGQSRLLISGANDAAWSPTGQFIAFDRRPVGDPSIYVVPPSGGTPTLIRAGGYDVGWSPGGRMLAFTNAADGRLCTIDVRTMEETCTSISGENASWAPNGRAIAYSVYNPSRPPFGATEIWSIAVDAHGHQTGAPRPLYTGSDLMWPGQPTWSGNSHEVYFAAMQGSDFDLWGVPAEGGSPARLHTSAGNDFDPSTSNNGQWVAYSHQTQGSGAASFSMAALSSTSGGEVGSLVAVHPNPFFSRATVRYELPEAAHVRIALYDLVGREVALVADGERGAGVHRADLDGAGLPSGAYVLRMETSTGRSFTQRAVLGR